MRTIKFLGIAVALAAVSVSLNAQLGRRFDHSSGINDLARLEARRIEHHPLRRGAMLRGAMLRGARLRRGLAMRAPMDIRGHRVAGPPRGRFRAGGRTNASPEQKELTRQFREKRQALRAQVQAGALTREQARVQMRAWTTEHRPTK
jgi:hypothetical protein